MGSSTPECVAGNRKSQRIIGLDSCVQTDDASGSLWLILDSKTEGVPFAFHPQKSEQPCVQAVQVRGTA